MPDRRACTMPSWGSNPPPSTPPGSSSPCPTSSRGRVPSCSWRSWARAYAGASHGRAGWRAPLRSTTRPGSWAEGAGRPAVAWALPAALLVALASLAGADRAALAQGNAAEVAHVVALIRAHAQPGATIVAPPYYALLTGTRIPGDAADTYILAQRVRHADPWAMRWVRHVTRDLG